MTGPWFTSSHSNDQGGACVEAARLDGAALAVRDTKHRAHGTARFSQASWRPFLTALADRTLAR